MEKARELSKVLEKSEEYESVKRAYLDQIKQDKLQWESEQQQLHVQNQNLKAEVSGLKQQLQNQQYQME